MDSANLLTVWLGPTVHTEILVHYKAQTGCRWDPGLWRPVEMEPLPVKTAVEERWGH